MRRAVTQTRPGQKVRVDVHRRDEFLADLAEDVRTGLSTLPKDLPPKYFYDGRGLRLFEDITSLPEYYPTRVELEILDRVGAELIETVRPEELVELARGPPARRTRYSARWSPVATAARTCRSTSPRAPCAAGRLAMTYGALEIHGVVGRLRAGPRAPAAQRQAAARCVPGRDARQCRPQSAPRVPGATAPAARGRTTGF